MQGDQYLRPLKDIQTGFKLQLDGYQHLVLGEFTTFADEEGVWQQVFNHVQDKPVVSLEREKQKILYGDIWAAFVKLMDLERLHALAGVLFQHHRFQRQQPVYSANWQLI